MFIKVQHSWIVVIYQLRKKDIDIVYQALVDLLSKYRYQRVKNKTKNKTILVDH